MIVIILSETKAVKGVKNVCTFFDDRWAKNRSVTDVSWSPKYPELLLGSYNKNHIAVHEPDGVVLVWNLHLVDRPEFVFHCQVCPISQSNGLLANSLVF
jgi:dynein intermediate chain